MQLEKLLWVQVDPSDVHSHTGRGDVPGEGTPAQCLDTRPFTGGLQGGSNNLWDVQTVELLYQHVHGRELRSGWTWISG